jgi:hypothetical protein
MNEEERQRLKNGVHEELDRLEARIVERVVNPLEDRIATLKSALQDVVGFCVDARETWPDWQEHPGIGVLFAKTTAILAGEQKQGPNEGG